jgi:HTH-type transcriptional regulator / antitoxin HipB
MAYTGQHIIASLRAAREKKGFSQRALSAGTGMPQSYISRMERGMIDLQLSSLIEVARVLDLEIMAVPRKLVPAVQAIVSGEASSSQSEGQQVRPAYTLDEDDDA